jgi:MFS family permease
MLKRYSAIRSTGNPALRVLLIGDAITLTAAAMLTPIYAIYVEEIGGSLFDAGLTAAALAFGAGLMAIIGGRFTDTVKNKKLLVVGGYFVIGLGFLAMTQVQNVLGLALIQLIVGLARPVYETAFDALYSIHLDKTKEAQEWGIWEGVSYFAAGIGAILGSLFVLQFSSQALFALMAGMCFIGALYVFKVKKSII